ncbi:MAG: DUF6599 family protein [Candidatus Omnitrophota bacterium]
MNTLNAESHAIPRQVREWKADGKDQVFDRKTIYRYIDGGAELYLTYDFRQVLSRKYIGPNNSEIILDIYDMGTSSDAFGIFTSEREDKDVGIGQGSEFGGGLLRFWKGSVFVSILNNGGNEKADQAVLELGKAVDDALPLQGPEPNLLKYLPDQNLDKTRIRYFHHALILDKHYFVANQNIFNLNSKTDCVLAEYPLTPKEPIVLLLIRFENFDQAKAAYDQFIKVYMPEAKEGIAQMENKKWTMAVLDRQFIRVVFEADNQRQAMDLQTAVKR